jgi:hypothetical protein
MEAGSSEPADRAVQDAAVDCEIGGRPIHPATRSKEVLGLGRTVDWASNGTTLLLKRLWALPQFLWA